LDIGCLGEAEGARPVVVETMGLVDLTGVFLHDPKPIWQLVSQ
jgi:hypothetical protein